MKNVSMKNIIRLFSFNMLINRKSIIGWSVAVTGIMSLYMGLFSSIKDIALIKMEAMPKELLQFVGMENMSDMSNYISYYGTIYGIVIVAVSIFSATFSSGLISKEEKSKSIEFLNSLAVSRTEIYIAKYITSTVGVAIVLSCAVIAAIVWGFIGGGDTFKLIDIISTAKITSFTALLFGAIGFKVAGVSSKLGAGGVSAAVVLISYMAGYLGQLLGEDGEFLLYLSPFITFSTQNVLKMGQDTMLALIIYLIIYLASLIAGCIGYNRRDLKI